MGHDVLGELEALSAVERGRRLQRLGVGEALRALDPQTVLDWLGRHVGGVVDKSWGRTAKMVGADWPRLSDWFARSKEHCLMAFDALHYYAEEAQLPPGLQSLKELHRALVAAQNAMGNPRTERILKDIKRVWPARKAAKRKPDPRVVTIGATILGGNESLQSVLWASLPSRQADGLEVLEAILQFAESRNYACIVDWREDPAEAVAMVLGLEPIAGQGLDSVDAAGSGELPSVLAALGRLIRESSSGLILMQFDVGSDAYPLAVVPASATREVSARAAELTGDPGSATVLG